MITRVFHPYQKWEDHQFGMYQTTCFMDAQTMITDCEVLLGCPEWLWESMQFVAHNWTHAAEQNLSNVARNRQAWLGQAACCFVHGAPEYITKLAWNNLTKEKQDAANAVADEVIQLWEERFLRNVRK
jgi:hypothetical protein